jgi:hypothetical protein
MSITTYSELKTAIAEFLNRSDLTAVIPTFISLAEADISRKLRHWLNEKRITTSLNEQFEFLPDDWQDTISLTHADGTEIRLVSTVGMSDLQLGGATTGKPRHYRITAGQIEVYPVPDAEYPIVLTYHARIPALSDTATTNWLLTNHPDILLYGALLHSAPYLVDDARIQIWGSLQANALDALNSEGTAAKFSGPLVMRNRRT